MEEKRLLEEAERAKAEEGSIKELDLDGEHEHCNQDAPGTRDSDQLLDSASNPRESQESGDAPQDASLSLRKLF